MTGMRTKSDRRAELLHAGRTVLAEKGFEATTIAEIVARAGVAQGTFYLYFTSKTSLVIALTLQMNEQIAASVRRVTADASSAAEVVERGVTAAFAQFASYRDILPILHSRTVFDHVSMSREEQFYIFHQLIADLIRQRQRIGDIAPTIHPDITARLISGLINHAADECYLYDVDTPEEVYRLETIRFIQRALGI